MKSYEVESRNNVYAIIEKVETSVGEVVSVVAEATDYPTAFAIKRSFERAQGSIR